MSLSDHQVSRRDFVSRAALASTLCMVPLSFLNAEEASSSVAVDVHSRGRLVNSYITFKKTKKGHVAFLGGSITEMKGHRPLMYEWLSKQFPETEFTFTDAGISSTCSTTGAFRLDRDVLSKGPVDLFFVEFAVNDDQDAHHSVKTALRGMEGIIRHLRTVYPNADIVMTYFVNQPIMDVFHAGGVANGIAGHQKVAERYEIPTIDIARQITKQIDNGQITWKEFGGVHPSLRGNTIVVDMMSILFLGQWKNVDLAKDKVEPHTLPAQLDPYSYTQGRLAKFAGAKDLKGWVIDIPDWKKYPGNFRDRYGAEETLHAETPGATCRFEFEGTTIGAFLLAGPDAGTVEYRVDGGPVQKKDLYHFYSVKLHYPRTVMFADELSSGKHTIELKVSAEKNAESLGHAVRILNFTLNGK
ncbi:MAG: GDSL-type esterase/lipase family protein [Planctomycetia bacterium]|nr:GDSL-type esterase/lipase family protein [Planctomycetia bacterium]